MIVIKDIKMPKSCYDCPFVKNERTNDYGTFGECGILEDYETINLLEHSKHPNCPLVEQEPKQVELEGDGYADGELVYDYGRCPSCGWHFEDGDKDWKEPYCCHCGQKLRWFKESEE